MKIFGIPYQRRQIWYLILDLAMMLFAIRLGHGVALGWTAPGTGIVGVVTHSTGASLFLICSSLITLYLADAYNPALDFRKRYEMLRLWWAIGAALPVQLLVYSLFPHGWWGRNIAVLISISLAALLTGTRAVLCGLSPRPAFRQRTLIVGAGQAGHLLARVIRTHEDHGIYDLIGMVDQPKPGNRRRSDYADDELIPPRASPAPVLGIATDLVALVKQHDPELIVVALRGALSLTLTQQLLECKARGVQIEDMPTVYKRLTGKVPVLHVSDDWLIFGPVFSGSSRFGNSLQRLVDIGIGVVGGVASLVFIVPAAILIKLESPGPVFYTQERLGRNERPFQIMKLRTMRNDAEAGGPQWSQGSGDPRVTRVGKWLRRSRIDELPQFINVLRGDMALVGPRPERAHFVNQLKEKIPFYGLRFSVKPGLTGWAQVRYRYGATDEDAVEKLCYELYAIQEMSPMLYALILLKTVQTVLLRPGS